MTKQDLLKNYKLGDLNLKNRIIMAPLTRRRAGAEDIPTDLNANYYTQRSQAGFIIAEATQISPEAKGYPDTPGIYSEDQVDGWRKVTESVHAANGLIFLQLWHVGRYSHPDLLPEGKQPVAPSPIAFDAKINTGKSHKQIPVPKELEIHEIKQIIRDFEKASENALRAGFDGIEIHGANGYLIDQFIQDGSNHRKDEYGGSIQKRCRFLFEIIEAVSEIWESKRIGVRLAPSGTKMGMSDSDSKKHFTYLIRELNNFNLAYLHLLEPWFDVTHLPNYANEVAKYYRKMYQGALIANGGFDQKSGNTLINEGFADMVSFGKLFISNPDLPKRFEMNSPLNLWDESTFYGGNEKGYTDYPHL
ncbi:alkene reductase [Bacteroidota bacterium]